MHISTTICQGYFIFSMIIFWFFVSKGLSNYSCIDLYLYSIFLFLKKCFMCINICLNVCIAATCMPCASESQKRALCPPVIGVTHGCKIHRVLRTEHGSSTRTKSALNHPSFSLALATFIVSLISMSAWCQFHAVFITVPLCHTLKSDIVIIFAIFFLLIIHLTI